ncbi:MAG: MJ0042-type zinc finger domain-containing protein, partial [Pseudomonadota bacterium]
MFTQCPECATVFPVSADALSISGGNVRCGACGAVFFAVQSLSDSLDEDGQIPTCFHSDHPPTLSDPGSDAPPIDDLFWPAPPASRESQSSEHAETPAGPPLNKPKPADPTPAAAKPAATDDSPPLLDLTDDEALEREFDRLINEPDTPEEGPQPAALNDPLGPTPAADPSGNPGPDSEAESDKEAWVAHRYGPSADASRPLASSEEADEEAEEAPVTAAAPPATSIESEASSTDETQKDPAISLSDKGDTLEPIEPIGPTAKLPEPDPNEPLPEVFTRAKSPSGEPSVDDDAPAEPPEVAAPLSGVA